MSLLWEKLPRDSAALFNPAFMAVLIRRGVQGAVQEKRPGLPWELAYLVVPMSLDAEVRESLPMRINAPVVSWVAQNPAIRSLLPAKLTATSRVVNEGLSLGLTVELFALDKQQIKLGAHALTKTPSGGTREVQDIQKAALYLGRWLTGYSSTAGLYSLFGVRP